MHLITKLPSNTAIRDALIKEIKTGWQLNKEKERIDEIKRNHEKYLEEEKRRRRPVRLLDMFEDALDAEDDSLPCQICNL